MSADIWLVQDRCCICLVVCANILLVQEGTFAPCLMLLLAMHSHRQRFCAAVAAFVIQSFVFVFVMIKQRQALAQEHLDIVSAVYESCLYSPERASSLMVLAGPQQDYKMQ